MSSGESGKLLVLCVDRDNDVGAVLGVKTPIIGEEELLKVAIEYALRRPDDSDANAIFAAIQTYRELVSSGYAGRCEVALLAGLEGEGVQADMKILEELDWVIKKDGYTGAILVSDGPTDEAVAPLIQSRLPLISIRRVIVQQSRGVEETFVLLMNYAKKLITEEKYRKYSMGFTGAFVASYSILMALLPQFAWTLLLVALGAYMAIKGYGIDRKVGQIYRSGPVRFSSFVISLLLFFLGLLQGLSRVVQAQSFNASLISLFLLAPVGGQLVVVDLFVLGASLFLIGEMLDKLVLGETLRFYQAMMVVVLLISRQIMVEIAKYLAGSANIQAVLTWSFIVMMTVVIVAAVRYMETGFSSQQA